MNFWMSDWVASLTPSSSVLDIESFRAVTSHMASPYLIDLAVDRSTPRESRDVIKDV